MIENQAQVQAIQNQIYAKTLAKFLFKKGINFAVISPGSRNTPLSLALVETMPYVMAIDERSAGFIALGYARETQKHVILCCTSGSALSHYLPALTESYYATAPILVLSADRPERLQGCGAAQTIDQKEIFGKYATFLQMPTFNEISEELVVDAISKIDQVLFAQLGKYPKSIHVNLPFEEPLWLPVLETETFKSLIDQTVHRCITKLNDGHTLIDLPIDAMDSVDSISSMPKALQIQLEQAKVFGILIGAILWQTAEALIELLLALSKTAHVLVFCEASSQLRAKWPQDDQSQLIEFRCLEAICKSNALSVDVDLWIHIGTNHHSRAVATALQRFKGPHLMMADRIEVPSAYNLESFVYHGKMIPFILDLIDLRQKRQRHHQENNQEKHVQILKQLQSLKKIEAQYRELQLNLIAQDWWTGQIAYAINTLDQSIRNQLALFIANSMPYRDLDFGLMQSIKRVWSARGTNGIDGNLSSVIGGALATKQPVLAWLGDLAFLHDMGALMSLSRVRTPLLIIISQNGGGAIFQQLNVVESRHFETCFFTPYEADLSKLCQAFSVHHQKVTDANSLQTLVHQYFHKEMQVMPLIIEACFDANSDYQAHQKAWQVLQKVECK
jgi:2-succinyl-5-enolpyruvyl-6-hydroxy-3-cyclohexene-1-carboxylate synthase